MNNYQKAIKVKKVCESVKNNSTGFYRNCFGLTCPYKEYCINSDILLFSPENQSTEKVARAIKEENWKVD